jgi:hypothetical protein
VSITWVGPQSSHLPLVFCACQYILTVTGSPAGMAYSWKDHGVSLLTGMPISLLRTAYEKPPAAAWITGWLRPSQTFPR